MFVLDETTVIRGYHVYDQTSGPVRIPSGATPSAFGYQISDQQFRDTKQRKTPTSAFVFAIPIDDLGFLHYDQKLPQTFKKLSEAFSFPSQTVASTTLTSTVASVVDENTVINGYQVYTPSTGPVGLQAPPSTYGYQVSDQKLPQRFAKLSEPFSYPVQKFTFAQTPSAFGYQISDQKLPQRFVVVSEPMAYPYQIVPPSPVVVATDQYLIGGPDITEQFVTHGGISSIGISYTLNPLSRRTV